MMKLKPIFGLILILALALASCQAPTAAPTQAQMVNPASENCLAQGGTLEMVTRGDGGEYGICYFEDNRQCEEWALYNGKCSAGQATTPTSAAQVATPTSTTQIPRPSGYMDQIREFLVNFGQGLGLETIVDEAGNVIILKPASAGLEDRPGIVLQAHMDMGPRMSDDKDFETTVKSELAATEPEMSIQVQAVQPPAQVMDEVFQNTLIDALYGTPQNVIRMSDTVPDLVETSTNIGVTTVQDGQIQIVNYPRSSVNSELVDIAQMISSVWELAGYQAEITDAFSAWTPNPESPIVELMEAAYVDLFAAEPEISAVHAGLECGAIGGIYPDMDMISVGPTMNAVHTVSERLYIPSVEGMMNLLLEVLQRFPGE